MLKKLIGFLVAVASLAVIAFAVLNRGNYTSFVEEWQAAAPKRAEVEMNTPAEEVLPVEVCDSLPETLPAP